MDYIKEIDNLLKESIEENEAYNKWLFYEKDWLIENILSNKKIIFELFSLRNYNVKNIDAIILQLLPSIQEKRRELEKDQSSFQKKKAYLKKNENNSKIQITIEDEYALKTLIEKYKIYEFISWIHNNRNIKIVKYCEIRKNEILEQIYPIVKLSIRKVIGAKVISPVQEEFEEAVNNAWMNIIKYMPKMDTSKVMFSVFVATAHKSAYFFRCLLKKYKYENRVFSSFDNDKTIDPEYESQFEQLTYEDSLMSNNEEEFEIDLGEDKHDEYSEDIIEKIDSNKEESKMDQLKQSVLQYSYDCLSKSKNINIEKIFSEFFISLINKNIDEELMYKHSNIIVDVLNINELNITKINNIKGSRAFAKMLKDYIKIKIKEKLIKNNIPFQQNLSSTRNKYVDEIIEREINMLKIIMENRDNLLKELFYFKTNCLEKFPI